MFIDHNILNYGRMVERKYGIYKAGRLKNHPVNGLDTETYNGYAKIITDNYGNWCNVNSIEDALAFMTRKSLRSHHNFFYNIRFDFQAVIKHLPEQYIRELYKTGKCEYKEYKIGYIPRKMIRINHSKHSYKFYDLFPFYLGGLGKMAEKYLGAKKNEEGIDAARLNTDWEYWTERKEDIVKYCISDSRLTQRLGVLLQDTYKKALGFPPQRYVSQANVSKEYFSRVCDIPDIRKVSKAVKRYGFHCYHGGRFEILKKGYFKEVTLIDINSAYPYNISELTQCTNGKWYTVREADYDALHGYYMCVVDVPEYILPPFMVNASKTLKMFPKGRFGAFLTLNEVKEYGKYCDIKVLKGYEFRSKDRSKPFQEAILKLYALKKATPKEDFRYDIYKKTGNAFYGTFYEKQVKDGMWVPGKMFNPLYAPEITANTRIALYIEAMKYGNRNIGFATDSIIVEGNVAMCNNKELGKFDVDKVGAGVVLQSGIYEIAGEHKTRGMMKGTNIKVGNTEYENIFEYIKDKPELEKYEWEIERPVNLGEAIVHHKKKKIADINVWQTFKRSIDINRDRKRVWDGRFENGGELYEKCISSVPIDVGWIEEAARRRRARRGK